MAFHSATVGLRCVGMGRRGHEVYFGGREAIDGRVQDLSIVEDGGWTGLVDGDGEETGEQHPCLRSHRCGRAQLVNWASSWRMARGCTLRKKQDG